MAWTSYRDLIVWQKSMDLVDEIYRISRLLPKEELYCLSSQMRRAVVSIPSNIAEGHGRRNFSEFRQFLSIAKGSVSELETQIEIGIRQSFFSCSDCEFALNLCTEIQKMLTGLLTKSD